MKRTENLVISVERSFQSLTQLPEGHQPLMKAKRDGRRLGRTHPFPRALVGPKPLRGRQVSASKEVFDKKCIMKGQP